MRARQSGTGRSGQKPERAAPTHAPDRAKGRAGRLLDMQQAAGNHAVVVQLPPVQRHLAETTPEEVGDEPAAATAEPAAGTGTTTGKKKVKKGPSRGKLILAKLATTDTGRWVLGILKKWKVKVHWSYAGMGSYHQGGEIYINKNLSVDAATMVMYHEAQHAQTFKSGKAADIESLTRAAYVKAKIADEAEAVVRQIEGTVPLEHRGASMAGSGLTMGLIDRYRKAFYKKRDQLERDHPKMTRAEINKRCRRHTRDSEVTNWFHDGTFVTSTGKISYSDHYGRQWDAVHKPPAKK
jgi:hypothetical protein